MAEYIDREILLNTLDEVCRVACPYSERRDIAQYVKCGACPLGSAFDFIDDIPAADVVKRKRGEWKQRSDPYGWFETIPVCSICGCTTKWRETYMFCPNCGADMREES